ncbi:MAG: 4-alpha-glucanotransferase, partial [Oscillospiraceae bacterium]|nr:4-alpha-glucanotransferase [Oscillospiraceae bacterium]
MRKGGVLMHLSSLPGPGPIGTMGRPARAFADFLARAGQAYWQLLPIGPTGYGDSPYQSFCTYAGNPCFIDPETLAEQGLLDGWSGCADNPDRVDYAALWPAVRPALERAAACFLRRPPGDFADFCTAQASWLED